MQVTQAAVSGLQTSPNVLSSTSPGSQALADECVLAAPGLLQPRRGFAAYGGAFGVIADRAKSMAAYGGGYVVAYGSSGLAHSTGGAAFTTYPGTFAPVSTTLARMRFVQAAGNLYFNTTSGTYGTTALGTTPYLAGAPAPYFLTAFPSNINTWQAYDTAVAYRATLVRKDANNNVVESAPSARLVYAHRIYVGVGGLTRAGAVVTVATATSHNFTAGDTFTLSPGEANFAAGTYTVASVTDGLHFTYASAGAAVASSVAQDFQCSRGATLSVGLPTGTTDSHWVRVYRSEMTSAAADTPSDDLYMVAEQKVSASDLSSGYSTLTDAQPEELLGDPLYTDTNEGAGILASHQPLPVARDMCFWPAQNRMLWGNTKGKHAYSLQLLGVSGTTGLVDGSTITIVGPTTTKTYRAKTSPAVATDFQLFTGYSPAVNVEKTAQSLCYFISNPILSAHHPDVVALYVSGDTDTPGKILLQERGLGANAFRVYATGTLSAWNPVLPSASSADYQSNNSSQPNGVTYSEPGTPEHVGVTNWLEVGQKSDELLRSIPQRDKVTVFKSDGIYTLSGSSPPFTVQKISEAVLWGADTAVPLSESVFAFTNQGVVRVNDAGVQVISRPVENQLEALYGSVLQTDAKRLCFALGYESSRLYCLWLPTVAGLDAPDVALVYNTSTQAWTRWRRPAPCGLLDASIDRLVLARYDAATLAVERKAMDATDFADEETAVTVSSSSGYTAVLVGIVACAVGDRLVQGDSSSVITAVDTTGGHTTLTMGSLETWSAAAAAVYPALHTDVTWNVITGGDAAANKQWQECSFFFQDNGLSALTAGFETEQSLGESTVTCAFPRLGDAPFGVGNFGDSQRRVLRLSSLPKKAGSQMTVSLHIREAQSSWKLAGLVLTAEGVSERTRR